MLPKERKPVPTLFVDFLSLAFLLQGLLILTLYNKISSLLIQLIVVLLGRVILYWVFSDTTKQITL